MIAVIGLGFVGLTTALGFADKGYKVYGFDVNQEKMTMIKQGEIPFLEPNLKEALERNINKNFIVVSNIKEAVNASKSIFICVGTPNDDQGKVDLTYIEKAIEAILKEVEKMDYKILVIKSTVPPATTKEKIIAFIEKQGFIIGKNIGLANNPEFLREGYAWEDFTCPDRVVIGEYDKRSGDTIEEIYKPFNAPVHRVSLNTGEFIKYLSNTLLATLISYSNEMSLIANAIKDIDIAESFQILHEDKRWSGQPANIKSYAYPGCGFGGYCLPKDTQALVARSREHGYDPKILENVLKVNQKIKSFVVDRISQTVKFSDTIGVLGLSFKPDSDDVRESPSRDIIQLLIKIGYKNIIAYDPVANNAFKKSYNLPIQYAASLSEIVKKTDNLIILTAWKEFKNNKNLFKNKRVFDFRYILK